MRYLCLHFALHVGVHALTHEILCSRSACLAGENSIRGDV